MNIKALLHTIAVRILLLFIIGIGMIPIGIMMILPARMRYTNRLLFWMLNTLYWGILKVSLIPIAFKGRENIPTDQPVIFASNHQSSIDIPLVGVLAHGKPHIWLARSELLKSLMLRFVLPRLAVVVDVNTQEKATSSLRSLMRIAQKSNADIMIFPEGERHPDDAVHEFYGGFVILAKLLKRPVVPVYIDGANRVYPPNTFLVNYYPVEVVVGKPFVLQENETDEQFKQRVYQWFLDQSEK